MQFVSITDTVIIRYLRAIHVNQDPEQYLAPEVDYDDYSKDLKKSHHSLWYYKHGN